MVTLRPVLGAFYSLDRVGPSEFAVRLASDLVVADHRPFGFAHGLDREGFLDTLDALPELAGDVSYAVHRVDCVVGRTVLLGQVRAVGAASMTSPANQRSMLIVEVAQELLTRIEYYDEADLDTASARFRELTSGGGPT